MSGTDDEIQVRLTANVAELSEGMEEAAATVQSSVQAQIAAFGELDALLAGHTVTLEQLAGQEQALDALQQAGLISTQELTEAFAALDTAEAALATSTEEVAEAQIEANAAMTLSGGVARELGVMIGELARGNYTRLEGSTITLANRTGILSTALSALLSPLGLVVAAAAVVGYGIFEAGERFDDMQGTLLATGQAAGTTAGQLVDMADHIGASTGSITNATEAVQMLAESGRFAGQDLTLVSTAAADMSALTGESIQSCVAQIERLQEDPVKAVAKLNDQYHFLTASQFQEMEAAQQSGDTMQAASIAYQAMADKMEGRTDELNQHVNVLIRTWREMRSVWSETMESADTALGGGDTATQLADAQRILKNFQDQNAALLQVGSSSVGLTQQIQSQTQVVEQLTAKLNQEKDAAGAIGDAAQKSAAQIDSMAQAYKKSGGDQSAAEQDRTALQEMQVVRTVSLSEEKAYWELIASTAQQGSEEYRQAISQLIELHNKQAQASKEAARQAVEAQKQQDAAVIDGLQEERAATQENTAARIQADNTVLQSAIRMYGLRSSQGKSALDQLLADERSYDDAIEAAQQKALADQEKILQTNVKDQEAADQEKIKSIENQFRTGQISAQQYVEAAKSANQQALDDFAQYIAKKTELDQGNVQALQKDAQEWVAETKALSDQLAQEQMQAAQKTQQQWTQASNQISRTFDSALNSMLFSTQSHTQQMQNLYRMLGQEVIKLAVEQPLENWIRGEVQKTAATLAGVAQRSAAQSAGAASGMAASAAMNEKQIMNDAYTAAANTYNSVSSIPVVGWLLAPPAAAAAFAAVEAYGNISSASGGWDRVPFDDAPALLHRNEMVLPAHLAENVRNMTTAGSGSGSSTQNIHIHANDARSFGQLLQRDPQAFAKAARRAMNPGGRRR